MHEEAAQEGQRRGISRAVAEALLGQGAEGVEQVRGRVLEREVTFGQRRVGVGLDEVEISFDGVPTHPVDGQPIREARSISARCNGVRVWSLYVPNGRTPDDSHYTYKLAWLDALRNHITLRLAHDPAADMMLAGDWNVAQTDDDVWDREYFEGRTHVTPPERAAVQGFLEAGLVDSALPYAPGYTFWDYTQLRFPRNEGMRIDYAFCSPALDTRIMGAVVDRAARKAKGASDHAPVVFDIAD